MAVIDKADNGLAPATADVDAADASALALGAHHGGGIVTMAASGRVEATIPADFSLQFETASALHYKTPRAGENEGYMRRG